MEFQIKHTTDGNKGRFYMQDGEEFVSELTYQNADNKVMIVDHTKTREDMQGNGLASKIVDYVVNYARENDLKINPVCPFVKDKFKETASYEDVHV